MSTTRADAWLTRPRAHRLGRLQLVCFSYAGGSASAYRTWPDDLPADVDVRAVQLPGRDNRLAERPFTRLPDLVEAVADALEPHLCAPFAFFGHSMGALVAFELTRELRRRGEPQPVQLFVSACRAPQLPDPDPPIHLLPEPELLEELRRLDGTPGQVFENPELRSLVLPTVRADFSACETYVHEPGEPLAISIRAFGGVTDNKVSQEQLEGWRQQTSASFGLRVFSGNHFYFLGPARTAFLSTLSHDLGALLDELH
jgi:medium-chain acyl-[acyl-carrier-protein] hydrolase